MKRLLLIAALLTCATAEAQGALVLLDPARGGAENGARVADRVDEKDAVLHLAERISILLKARGLDVEMTRDDDTAVASDARAALANRTHPIACIVLHATGTGRGVHLYSTTLHQTAPDASRPVAWDEAQSPYADRSHALAADLLAAFTRSKLAASSGRSWLRPLDNMQCPAVAIEMAPVKDGTAADDLTYQGHVADAIAAVMLSWRGRVAGMTLQPAPSPVATPPVPAASSLPAASSKPAVSSLPAASAKPTPSSVPAAPPVPAASRPAVTPRVAVPAPAPVERGTTP